MALAIATLHNSSSERTSPRFNMPAVSTGKVLVTGANGYVAAWVVKALLEQGFAVRGTVRSEGKSTHLRSLFKSYGDKLEFAIVEDIVKASRSYLY